MADFSGALTYLLANEGPQYVNDPVDAGGPTRMGVTLVTLAAWRKRQGRTPPTADDVRLLTVTEATAIYRANYWTPVRGDDLADNGIACLLLDIAANCGTGRACKLAQAVVNDLGGSLVVDGAFGPKTLAAVNAADRRGFLRAATQRQLDYYDDIVARDITQRKFLRTWLRRAAVYRDLYW